MESKLLAKLKETLHGNNMPDFYDARGKLAINENAPKYKQRNPEHLKGLVWHQEEAWGSIESVAEYHTGKFSHLYEGGVESIAYSFGIRRNGQIVLCNDIEKATWSQGTLQRPGDENSEFMAVMFEGFFRSPGITDPSAGEPTDVQIISGLLLWKCCKEIWGWNDNDLYGHYHFGKRFCPGSTLQSIIESNRNSAAFNDYNFSLTLDRQKALSKLSYYEGPNDGIWGTKSRQALTRFQKENELTPDGIWGPLTERKIIKLLGT